MTNFTFFSYGTVENKNKMSADFCFYNVTFCSENEKMGFSSAYELSPFSFTLVSHTIAFGILGLGAPLTDCCV